MATRDGSGLRVNWQANPEVCGAEDLAAYQRRFAALLEAIAVVDPHRPVGGIDLLTPDERDRLLVGCNGTSVPIQPTTLPALFEAQVRASPEAVVFADTTVTYSQLTPMPTGSLTR